MVFINHFINQYKSTWSWSFSATSSYFDEVAGHFNSPHLLLALLKNNISICVMQKLRILISMKVFFIPFDFVFSPFAGKLINTIYYSKYISFMSFVFLVGKFHFSFISFSPFFSRLYWQKFTPWRKIVWGTHLFLANKNLNYHEFLSKKISRQLAETAVSKTERGTKGRRTQARIKYLL